MGVGNRIYADPKTTYASPFVTYNGSELAPGGLSATPGSSILLSWSALTGATAYNVYRGTSSGSETLLVSGIVGTSYTDSSAIAGVTYFYRVTGTAGADESGYSNEASAAKMSGHGSGGVGTRHVPAPAFVTPYKTLEQTNREINQRLILLLLAVAASDSM